MAKYHHGVLSGKVGNKVYTVRNGKNCVQSMPKKSTKPATTKQIIQRARFCMVTQFVGPLRNILNQSYARINRKKDGINVAIQQIHAEAVIGEYPDFEIDFSKVTLIRGNLRIPIMTMSFCEERSGLKLDWLYSDGISAFPNDELIAMIYCQSLEERWAVLATGIYRADEQGLIKMPASLSNREIHIWVFYRSTTLQAYSQSSYMGNLFLPEIEDHENL